MVRIKWDKQWGIPAITGIASFIAGTGVGYMVASARLSKKVKEIEANQKMLREHFESISKSKEPKIAEPIREDGENMVQHVVIDEDEYDEGLPQVEDDLPDPDEDEPFVPEPGARYVVPPGFDTRVFLADEPEDDWDYDVEMRKRGSDKPYIIHRDEFMDEESGFRQSSLTYYSGDNILCDEKESPIYNHEIVAGTLRFGHGSKDRNIVYVRNPVLESEYEIILDEGHYQVEVLGAVIEDEMGSGDLKHSIHKFHKD